MRPVPCELQAPRLQASPAPRMALISAQSSSARKPLVLLSWLQMSKLRPERGNDLCQFKWSRENQADLALREGSKTRSQGDFWGSIWSPHTSIRLTPPPHSGLASSERPRNLPRAEFQSRFRS